MLKRDAYKVIDCYIEPITTSDHGPVAPLIQKQPNEWRMNVLLLNNPEIVQIIKKKKDWNEYMEHNDNGEVSV